MLAVLVINIFVHQRDASPFFLVLRHKIFGIFLDSFSPPPRPVHRPVLSVLFASIFRAQLFLPAVAATLICYLGCCDSLLTGPHPCPWSVLSTAARDDLFKMRVELRPLATTCQWPAGPGQTSCTASLILTHSHCWVSALAISFPRHPVAPTLITFLPPTTPPLSPAFGLAPAFL